MSSPSPDLPLAGQEARILLTAVCNYRCIFCHNEGVDRSASAFRPDAHTLFSLIQDIVRLGGRDLTLTGGEPLLHKDLALEATGHLARICPGARMTIVTNGSLPDQNWIEKAAAFGNLRINLSLHSCNPDIYRRITGQDRFSFEHIARRIAWLRRAGIPFKINCVALRDYNTSRQSLARSLSFRRRRRRDCVENNRITCNRRERTSFSLLHRLGFCCRATSRLVRIRRAGRGGPRKRTKE